jgi:hypothetical protein
MTTPKKPSDWDKEKQQVFEKARNLLASLDSMEVHRLCSTVANLLQERVREQELDIMRMQQFDTYKHGPELLQRKELSRRTTLRWVEIMLAVKDVAAHVEADKFADQMKDFFRER